jgi:type IV pilus assembly protein PilW
MKLPTSGASTPRTQGGYTLIEISIAMLIAIFLIGGLLTVVQDNRRTFTNQGQLSQLQDQERLGMMMITKVIESAGYFPDPSINTAGTLFQADGNFAPQQVITGSGNSISVRFATGDANNIARCDGSINIAAVAATTNTFSVAIDPDTNASTLYCTRDGNAAVPLVPGVEALKFVYGVKRSSTGNSVDTYVADPALMGGASGPDWNKVVSVQVTLTFKNPLYVAGTKQPQTIDFTRVVAVMAAGGVATGS